MGCWGMGLTQSDEYCEVYDRFIKEYDKGKPVADITKNILEEYLEMFDEDDGVLHDVYFALGKAEWMCGGISDEIFKRITQIIESGENIAFLLELEATDQDLKQRKRNLNKFLTQISTPKEKARKRKMPEEKYVPEPIPEGYLPLPKIKAGDVFAYKHSNGYTVFGIANRIKDYIRPGVYTYMWCKTFENVPTLTELKQEAIFPCGYFFGDTFPNKEDLVFIDNMIELKKLGRAYVPKSIHKDWPTLRLTGNTEKLIEEYPSDLGLTIDVIFKRIIVR
ncbi:MAG: hypothetical protein UE295_02210 [Acutalibacteraceae bacterium]|nr:hypothetical protein [Acutalibacteraceae bacterium]